MRLVDSHCHLDQLDLTPYSGDLSKVIAHAQGMGVEHFLCVCITLKDFPAMLNIAESYANISASVGLHPNEKDIHKEPTAEDLVLLSQHKKIVAIGETGLDYYRSTGDVEWQRERFRQHIRAAKSAKKPLIIHTRQAKADTIQIMREENADAVGGVMHCFTEDWEMAQLALDLNFYISFSGIVTFRNAVEIQDVAKRVPLDRMLIETDSPYLAPNPHRGKANEPAYVRYVAEYIAQLREVSVDAVGEQTTENFYKLFKLSS
ncbi:MAG: TatD family hydrolase [Gammaproteobacteria bacterium]